MIKQTRLLFLSAGHSNTPGRDQGAPGIRESEGIITARIRNKVVTRLRSLGYTVYRDIDNSVTSQTVAYVRSLFLPKSALVADIHCNSVVNREVSRTEVVIPDTHTKFEMLAATRLLDAMSRATGIRKGSVLLESQTYRKKLLWMSIDAENVLLELGFISNPSDYNKIINNEEALVIALCNELEYLITN